MAPTVACRDHAMRGVLSLGFRVTTGGLVVATEDSTSGCAFRVRGTFVRAATIKTGLRFRV